MVKSYPKEVRKTGRANEQTSAKDGEELPKRNGGRQKVPRGSQGKQTRPTSRIFLLSEPEGERTLTNIAGIARNNSLRQPVLSRA
jgi:hypothetical protein